MEVRLSRKLRIIARYLVSSLTLEALKHKSRQLGEMTELFEKPVKSCTNIQAYFSFKVLIKLTKNHCSLSTEISVQVYANTLSSRSYKEPKLVPYALCNGIQRYNCRLGSQMRPSGV